MSLYICPVAPQVLQSTRHSTGGEVGQGHSQSFVRTPPGPEKSRNWGEGIPKVKGSPSQRRLYLALSGVLQVGSASLLLASCSMYLD